MKATAIVHAGRWLLALAIVGAFATFVWPTLYRPMSVHGGGETTLAMRQNRITGQVEVLTPRYGWIKIPVGR